MHFSLCEVARITRLCKSFNACVFAPINDWTEETSTFGAREEDFFVGCFLVADDIGLCPRGAVSSSSSSSSMVVVVMVFVIFPGEAKSIGLRACRIRTHSHQGRPPRRRHHPSPSRLSLSLSLSRFFRDKTQTCEDERQEERDGWCFFLLVVVVVVVFCADKSREMKKEERRETRCKREKCC